MSNDKNIIGNISSENTDTPITQEVREVIQRLNDIKEKNRELNEALKQAQDKLRESVEKSKP